MYLPPRPRMTPLYDYVLTPQDATPPSSFTNPGYPPSHTPHATPPSSQCNHPPQMRPHLPGTPKVNINQCRADLLPNLVSDTEGQLYYYCYLPSTNRYWSHNLRSMSGTQYHLPSLVQGESKKTRHFLSLPTSNRNNPETVCQNPLKFDVRRVPYKDSSHSDF